MRGWLPRGMSLSQEEWHKRHQWMCMLLWGHAVALPLFGLHRGVAPLHAFLDGGVIALIAIAATFAGGRRLRSALGAVGLITCSALLVHLSGGYIEAHFHFFVMIVVLTMYEDWLPFLLASAYVVVHHGVVGVLQSEAVYNHPDAYAHPWKWALIHGLFVGAAGIGGIVSWRLNEEARAHAVEASHRARSSEESDELKSRFVAMASHELRTPLTSISGFAQTLRDRDDILSDEQRREFVDIIVEQSDRLAQLVNDLLTVSRIESGKLQPRPEQLQLRAVLNRTMAELGSAVGDAKVEVDCPDSIRVFSDRRHLQQIVVNLVTNAVKYGSEPIEVGGTLETNGDGRTPRFAVLRVGDRGRGVSEEFRSQMFDRFAQSDAGIDRPATGTGLGLSIVKGLAEAQDGTVWYEPNIPHGAMFCVRLPVSPQRLA